VAELTSTFHESITTVNRNQWNNLVEQSDLGCVFHRYEWLLAVEAGLGYTPAHVVVRKDGNPIGLFPNFVTELDIPYEHLLSLLPTEQLPTGLSSNLEELSFQNVPLKQLVSTSPGFGGPVIGSNESGCLEHMFQQISENCGRPVISHGIKAKELGYMRYGKTLAKRGYSPTLLDCRFELNLDYDFDELVARMDSGRRKALRDARNSGYEVSELDFGNVVSSTYDRYITDMERVSGSTHSRVFFEELADRFADRLNVFSVEVDGTEAGRYVHVLDTEQSTLHYFYSAIGDESNYEYNPSELLHAYAIEWGQENGYRYYDFGSSGSSFFDGTFRYKQRYGARVIPTLRWTKGYAPLLWTGYKLGRRAYQQLAYGDQ